MNYKEKFVEEEMSKAKKRVERELEAIDGSYSRHLGSEENDLLCLMLTVPTSVIHHALGFNLYSDIPQKTKDSDTFAKELFWGFLNDFELLAKLEFISYFIYYHIIDDGDPATAYYREEKRKDRRVRFERKIVHCEQDDPDAIPYIISSSEHHWNLTHKKSNHKTMGYIDCINYWLQEEKDHAVLAFDFDAEPGSNGEMLLDGKTFGQELAQRLETDDVIFGRQLVAELKAKYPQKGQDANS